MPMGRQEGSPLFAESIANYDNRTWKGRKKLLVGIITVGVAILLTLAIAIPLSADKNNIPNSTGPAFIEDTNTNSRSSVDLATPEQGQPNMILKLSMTHPTKDSCDSEDMPWYPRAKKPHHHRRSTKKTGGDSDDDDDPKSNGNSENNDDSDSHDPHRPWPPKPPTRRPLLPRTTRSDNDDDSHYRPKTKSPRQRTTKKSDYDDVDDDSNKSDDCENSDDSHNYHLDRPWPPKSPTRKPWWPRPTKKMDDDDDCEESNDHPWHPKTRKSWWPWWPSRRTTEKKKDDHTSTPLPAETTFDTIDPCRHVSTTDSSEDETIHFTTNEPNSTQRDSHIITTIKPTIIPTIYPTQTPDTSELPSPDQRKCRDIPYEFVSLIEINHFANVWWYEQARVQSPVSQMPINLISCSKGYFEVKDIDGVYTPEGATVTYTFLYNTGTNQTYELTMKGTASFSQWFEYYDDKEIQLSFITRLNDSLLTYECSPSKNSPASYSLRIWSLEPNGTMDLAAQSLEALVDAAGLNHLGLPFREIDQSDC